MSMLTDITLGQYFPIDSFIHRLDPRTKILVIFIGMTGLLFMHQLIGLCVAAFFIFLGIRASRLPVSLVFKNLRPFLWLFLITFFIHIFFSEGLAVVKIPYTNINISKEGIINGFSYSLRLALLITFAALLTLTTSPIEITDALETMFAPLKRFKLPVHELIMMMTLSLRFIPTLIMEAEKLQKAQISRGVSFRGNIIRRVKNIIPLILPLFLSVFRRADELAIAMDARCYTGGDGRTRFKELVFKKNDYYMLIGATLFSIIFFIIY